MTAPLDNEQRTQVLEQQVRELTDALAERVGELEVIGAIQRGVASQLDFQAIIELVGDKLREVFATGDVGIAWWDQDTDLIHVLYRYEHGVALERVPPRKLTPDHAGYRVLHERLVGVANNRAELTALRLTPRPGTDWCQSMVAHHRQRPRSGPGQSAEP